MLNVPEQGFNEKSGCVGLLDVIAGLLLYLFRAIFSKVMPQKRKKGKPRGIPFKKGDDSRRNLDGTPPPLPNDIPTSPTRFREPASIYNQISQNQCQGQVPIGARLRPKPDNVPCEDDVADDEVGQNWVVDEHKLLQATNEALKLHDNGRRHHTPVFKKKKSIKIGFGVRISFECGYKNCHFVSPLFKLYDETETGQPVPNVQIGVAMAKSELSPKTVEIMGATLNLNTPCRQSLQKSYSTTLIAADDLAEAAMADNRAAVTSAVRLRGDFKEGEIPDADAMEDGQYSNRDYHYPTGKSDSVSVPVIENVTGLGLLTEHTNLSHRDGTLPPDIHINAAETLASQQNVEKSYHAEHFPLYYSTMTTDGDTSVHKALETARANIGESRPLKRRGCHFHGFGAGITIGILD